MATIYAAVAYTISQTGTWTITGVAGSTQLDFNDEIALGGDGDGLIDNDEFPTTPSNEDKGGTFVFDGVEYDFIIYGGVIYLDKYISQADLESIINTTVRDASGPLYQNLFCFTDDALILTPEGEKKISKLEVGDVVVTRDNGNQAIRWIGQKTVSQLTLALRPWLLPIRFRAGSIGTDMPETDLTVSPQHRMLVNGPNAELLFGEPEVLVPAKSLINDGTITRVSESTPVTYYHIMFEGHEIIKANGTWTESFHPGEVALNAVEEASRDEIFDIFPELAIEGVERPLSRPALSRREARLLRRPRV